MLKKILYGILTLFLTSIFAFQAYTQVTTVKAGEWNDPTVWSTGSSPSSASPAIIINHAVSIPTGYAVAVDEVTQNAALTVATGGTMTLANGTGTDLTISPGNTLTVNGEFILNNVATLVQTGASINFGAGSTYRHRYTTTEGAPPVATWNTTSNFIIEGFTNTTAVNFTSPSWDQTYGNFTYACTGQRGIVNFNGLINDINGNFSVTSTGTSATQLTVAENNLVFDVAGDFTIGGTARFNLSATGTGSVLTIGGDFNFNSTNTSGSLLTNIGNFTINVNGDFLMNATGGRLFMAGSSGSTGTSTLNLSQNFILTAGQITESGGGNANGNIRFLANGEVDFVNTGSIINRINYYISAPTILNLSTYALTGAGNAFTLDGTIIVGSLEPTGAIRNATTAGNIRTATTLRTYSPGSVVIYRGSGPMVMSDGQPAAADVTTIIDNAQGVTLFQGTTAQATIAGTLRCETGMFFIGNRRINLNGTISYGTGVLGSDATSIIAIGGTTGGDFGSLRFDPSNNTLGVLTLQRTGASSMASIGTAVTISSQLNLTSGDLNNPSLLTMGNGATLSRWPTSSLLGDRPLHNAGESYNLVYRTASVAGDPATFATALELPAPADSDGLNNVMLNTAITTDVIQLSQDVTINGTMTLSRGILQGQTFTITMRGSSWADNSGNFVPGTSTVNFAGATTVTSTSSAVFGSIGLITGASLTTSVNTVIAGDISFQAGSTFDPSTFTTILTGTTTQTISAAGARFFNMSVAKSGGDVLLTSAMNLTGYLNFVSPSANCNFQSNGFLTLLSTSDAAGSGVNPGTSQIYRLASGNTVSGDVTVERFMSGEGRIYRYLSSPVTNASVASWQDDFPITGTFSNPSSGSPSCGYSFIRSEPSMYYYDQTVPGNEDAGYVAYPTSGNSADNPLEVGRGYAAFIRRCNSPTVVDVTGPINQGLIFFNLTYTNTGNPAADGYNLIGNPYPCTIDWDAGFSKTRISPTIAIRDNGNGGIMIYWDGSSGQITNGQIAVGQAFWVRATAANPILRISETSKVISGNTSAEFHREAPVSTLPVLLSDGMLTDRTYIKLREESSNMLDDWDAPKLDNDVFDFYAFSEDNIAMAIDSRQTVKSGMTIGLGIRDLEKREYTISLGERTGEFSDYGYTLIDHYTNQAVPFNDAYHFTVTDDPGSYNEHRFSIQLRTVESTFIESGIVYPNPVERFLYITDEKIGHNQVSLLDNVGKLMHVKTERDGKTIRLDLESVPTGIYFLNMFVDQKLNTLKIIKK